MKRSPWYKIFGYYLLVGVPLALLALLPKFFSSESGKYLFLSVLNKETGLQFEIEQLHLSWFGSQTAKKFASEESTPTLKYLLRKRSL